MTRYAYFDHTASTPQPVIGWYDTALVNYGSSLPPAPDLLEVLDNTFWANRLSATWGVDSGTFVDITPPPPTPPTTLQQQAIDALGAGIVLTSLATGSLNGTYDVSPGTQVLINGIIAGIGAGLGLPGGAGTFLWLDTSNNGHAFNETNFKNFATVVSGYTYTLNRIIGGAILSLPDFNITIA
jgi:hypothetical protein